MNVIGIAGLALVSAVIAVMLRRYNQEYAVVVSITAGVIILVQILANIVPAIRQINSLLTATQLPSEYGIILFKTLGICFLAQFAADSCRDAGESALASKVELAGKLSIVLLALPLFEKIASTALALIGG
ncbi:MAG: SpoIIIAC/SpoIIIAD family protein [Clostridium sp.]|uniref:SpoIIIAC/SpoIIIAD family protein n=1 Tax=Clostridium sp. TaxID=1506 RepID=UPI00290E7BFA|nr:SpoIIIAC/SpoIIIAD family protein [Clostridium sp.]MDU7337467.1 SpoIIIAC/SpoIIIAD family protein [Clostridium sp.]